MACTMSYYPGGSPSMALLRQTLVIQRLIGKKREEFKLRMRIKFFKILIPKSLKKGDPIQKVLLETQKHMKVLHATFMPNGTRKICAIRVFG